MKHLRNWLRPERPPGVSLHPARTVEVPASQPVVFDTLVSGIQQVLGGNVSAVDTERGTMEATFGLVNSERLSITVAGSDAGSTRVTIEARRGAVADQPASSSYVDALANFLQRS
jgi:hypothetical protein